MSCSLFWRPGGNGERVGEATLRDAIDREFGSKCKLDAAALPFLRGLVAGRVVGADTLIDAIDHHGEIDLWQEC